MKTKRPPLYKEWRRYKKLLKKGEKLARRAGVLQAKGNDVWNMITDNTKSHNLWEQAFIVIGKSTRLIIYANKIWKETVETYYGEDVSIVWHRWHENNDPTCHINGDIYF